MKRPYYSISRVASHDACFPQELIFFGCEPSKDLFEQTLCYAFQYICLLPIHTNGSAVCATKVRISFHITAIYAYLKVHLYEKLTPNALKQHIFEHLSKEKRKRIAIDTPLLSVLTSPISPVAITVAIVVEFKVFFIGHFCVHTFITTVV